MDQLTESLMNRRNFIGATITFIASAFVGWRARGAMPENKGFFVNPNPAPAQTAPMLQIFPLHYSECDAKAMKDFQHFFNKWLNALGPPRKHLGYEADRQA